MKRLADYKGEEAIELWADLLEPLTEILTDEEVKKVVQGGGAVATIVKTILKDHSKAAETILLRIDPEPIDALNIVLRLVALVKEIGQRDEIKSFFGFAAQGKTDNESSGLHTENTEAIEK